MRQVVGGKALASPAFLGSFRWFWGRVEATGEVRVLPQSVAVAPDVHDVAVMHEAVNERGSHDFIVEDFAQFFNALVTGEDGGRVFVAPGHQLEEEHGAGLGDREVADLVDHHQRGEDERAKPMGEAAGGLRFFEGVELIRECGEVDAAAALRRGGRQRELRGCFYVCQEAITLRSSSRNSRRDRKRIRQRLISRGLQPSSVRRARYVRVSSW